LTAGGALLIEILVGIAFIALGFAIERRWPARRPSFRTTLFNIGYQVPASLVHAVLLPAAGGLSILAVNALGGGLIALPARGWLVLPGLLVYALAMDFGEYMFHRAQHKLPFLWSMHSLHHSDAEFNVSTTNRHFWLDAVLKAASIYLVAGVIFKVGPIIVAVYSLLTFYNYISHLNVRLGFGRWWWVINSPHYHRIHHSLLPEHQGRNFAGLFPIFDVMFGSHYVPGPAEFPPTGLTSGEIPSGVLEAMLWPLHDRMRTPRTWRHSHGVRVKSRGR
jgi:sterol desaturase/sphingolipid hydroxylase (fatty acid hydroxylase superfamily)